MNQLNSALISSSSVVECIKNNSNIFIIPITIHEMENRKVVAGHANCLIYRRQYNHIEHFEPHGQEYNHGEQSQNINYILSKFIERINENIGKMGHAPITLIRSSNVCPNHQGFQSLESRSSFLKTPEEPDGYCGAWSMFFAEMCFKNPTKTSNELIRYILNSIPRDKNMNDYLRELIRGYSQLVNDKLIKYVSKLQIKGIDVNSFFANTTHAKIKGNVGTYKTDAIRVYKMINKCIEEDLPRFQKMFEDDVSPNSVSLSQPPISQPKISIKYDICPPRCKKGTTCKNKICLPNNVKAVSAKRVSLKPPSGKPLSVKPTVSCPPRCAKGSTCKNKICQPNNTTLKQVPPISGIISCPPRCAKGTTCKNKICQPTK